VLSQLIQTELLRQGGEDMGIQVSDLIVRQKIQKMEIFQKDGRFITQQRYEDLLSQNRMTPSGFEGGVKSDLQTDRVTGDIGSFALIPDSAVDHWLAYSEEEIKLSYMKFDPASFEDKVEIEEGELAAWFGTNKENYRSDPKIRLKYLLFDLDTDLEQVQPAEEELKALYETRKESYQQSEQRHARHILLKIIEGDSEASRTEKKNKAEEILELARQADSDFAALAEQYSEGPTKTQGGDLGFFAAGRMVPAFDKVVFSMRPGDLSEVVKTAFGYHIIKLEEIRPASVRSFAQVKDNLAVTLKRQQAKGLTFKRATTAYEAIMRAGSLDKYSQEGEEEVLTADYFARDSVPEGMVADPKFLATAFTLKKGELSSIVETSKGYAVIFVEDVQEPGLPELDNVRDRVLAAYTKEMSVKLAGKAADELLAASREKGGLQEDAAGDRKIIVADFLKRSASAGKDAPPAQILREGFRLPWNKKLAEAPVQIDTTYYVYEVTERRAGTENADADANDDKRDEAGKQLLASARNELITSWLSALRAQATITTNQSLLQ
jgi:peptidyl-prolyl cis-trans isomerase D